MNSLIIAIAGCVIGLVLAFYATGGELRIVTTYAWECGPIGRLRFILFWLAIPMLILSGYLLMHLAIWGVR